MSEKRWLSVDLSARPGEIALGQGQSVQWTQVIEGSRQSEALLPALAEGLAELGWEMSGIEALYSTSGPGGFTGMRVALASLKAMASALKAPLHLVSSPEATALAALRDKPNLGPLAVLVRAGAQRWGITPFGSEGEMGEEVVLEKPPAECPQGSTLIVSERWKDLPESLEVTVRPLRAGEIPLVAESATTLQTAQTPEELIPLSPRYYALNYKKWDRPVVTFGGVETTPQSLTKTSAGAQTPPTPG